MPNQGGTTGHASSLASAWSFCLFRIYACGRFGGLGTLRMPRHNPFFPAGGCAASASGKRSWGDAGYPLGVGTRRPKPHHCVSPVKYKKTTHSPGTRRGPWYHPDSASPRSAQQCSRGPDNGGRPEATTWTGLRIEGRGLSIDITSTQSSVLSPHHSLSPLGSEGNFGGHPRRWLAAIGHRSLCASTRVLASSQPCYGLGVKG
jgi:hypothetical protein